MVGWTITVRGRPSANNLLKALDHHGSQATFSQSKNTDP
jgi:hypothetical protein